MTHAKATGWATMTNARSIDLCDAAPMALAALQRDILSSVADGERVAALFASPSAVAGAIQMIVVLADDDRNRLHVGRTIIDGGRFPSLTPACTQVHLFEREMAEQFGIVPTDHPWLKRVRYEKSWTGRDAWGEAAVVPGAGVFYRVSGDDVHEVAVGPVHAGVIEPGHFRFQCHGERVFHLEIALGYQHRGIERAMIGGPTKRSMAQAETIAGDTTIAHATAYSQVIETLTGSHVSARAEALRGIALELERLANHTGDLGALANDVGFLPTASYCGRIRGDYLNMTALLCGNRFGRGMIRPGGVGFDMDASRIVELASRLTEAAKDTAVAVNLLWDTPSVMARFEDTGLVVREVAKDLGLVGPAVRASGLSRDARHDQPSGIFRFAHIPVSTCDSGDVFARAFVRWLEIQQSIAFIQEQLRSLPAGESRTPVGMLHPNRLAVAIDEGWRGEVCHVAMTDGHGRFSRYKIIDPSFHNWTGLAMSLRDQQISDFPLCNKSFNLSYCGHDL